jgi:predicted DNA binding CopG/RHH family protein
MTIKNDYLDDEEQQILEDFENGEFQDIDGDFTKRKRELQQIAKNTFNKTRNINIRLTERDLHRLKAKAIEEGIPYQTLAASILHKTTAK